MRPSASATVAPHPSRDAATRGGGGAVIPAPASPAAAGGSPDPWWRRAVVYEVYPRSFADASGDGQGDLRGLIDRLPYLSDLGVDAVWISPWYPSPLADGGYDVADYCDIDPMYGTLDDARALIEDLHTRGIRLVVDLVANHTSRTHPWFEAALAAGPGSPERARYCFRDGRGHAGELPPNNWISAFGGPAWTRVVSAAGVPEQWYLHTFAPEQPDLDWTDEGVRADFDAILRFWLDLGVDGIRVDAAPAMGKDPGLPDADYGSAGSFTPADWVGNPHWDVDVVHDVLRRWRALADAYDGDRMFVTESVVNGVERLSRYVRPDEMHTAFNFPFLTAAWGPGLRRVIDDTLATFQPVGAPPTWVLASHDETRLVTRYGRAETGTRHLADVHGRATDLALGTRRARAAALLMLALPGGAYVYQGEELGLPEVEDIPDDRLQDPIWRRSGHTERGRDGCRVPLPWTGDEPPYGFTDAPAEATWLPQPSGWGPLTVAAQDADPDSMLNLYRAALRLRRSTAGFASDRLAWRDVHGHEVLDFERGDDVRCVVNVGAEPVPLEPGWDVLLSSAPLGEGVVGADVAVWLRRAPAGS